MLTSIKRAYPDKYIDKGMLSDAVNSLIADVHKRNSPGELADVQIVMAPDDKDGRQNMIVTARNDDGTYMMPVYVNSDMLYQQILAREKARVNTSASVLDAMTPPVRQPGNDRVQNRTSGINILNKE